MLWAQINGGQNTWIWYSQMAWPQQSLDFNSTDSFGDVEIYVLTLDKLMEMMPVCMHALSTSDSFKHKSLWYWGLEVVQLRSKNALNSPVQTLKIILWCFKLKTFGISFRTNIMFILSFATNNCVALFKLMLICACPLLASAGCWGGSGLSGHHVHAGLSWPRPWVPAVPRRGGGAWGGGGRRRQGEGIGQRQRCGKHSGFGNLRRAHQTGRQGRHARGSLFSRGEVSSLGSFLTYAFCFCHWFVITSLSGSFRCLLVCFTDFALCCFFELDAPVLLYSLKFLSLTATASSSI